MMRSVTVLTAARSSGRPGQRQPEESVEGFAAIFFFRPRTDQVIVEVGKRGSPGGVAMQHHVDIRSLAPRSQHWFVEPAEETE